MSYNIGLTWLGRCDFVVCVALRMRASFSAIAINASHTHAHTHRVRQPHMSCCVREREADTK